LDRRGAGVTFRSVIPGVIAIAILAGLSASNAAPAAYCDRTAAEQPAWSADGKTIAFIGEECLFVVDARGGRARVIGAPISRFAWTPRGARIAFSLLDTLKLVTVRRDGTGRVAIEDDEGGYSWSPDGARVAFVPKAGGVWVANGDGTG